MDQRQQARGAETPSGASLSANALPYRRPGSPFSSVAEALAFFKQARAERMALILRHLDRSLVAAT